MKRRWTAWLFLALLVGGGAFHGCSEDPSGPRSQLFFPESWAGVWRLTLMDRDCDTDSFVGSDVSVDTICAGLSLDELFDAGDYPIELGCTGSFTDTHLDATCTGRDELLECDVRLRLIADRADSTITGYGSLRISGCPEAACTEFDLLGRRLAPAPPSCPPASSGLVGRLLARSAAGRGSPGPEPRARHDRE